MKNIPKSIQLNKISLDAIKKVACLKTSLALLRILAKNKQRANLNPQNIKYDKAFTLLINQLIKDYDAILKPLPPSKIEKLEKAAYNYTQVYFAHNKYSVN